MNIELLPCPFCEGEGKSGSRKAEYDDSTFYMIFCEHCLALGPVANSTEKAAQLWNKRKLTK